MAKSGIEEYDQNQMASDKELKNATIYRSTTRNVYNTKKFILCVRTDMVAYVHHTRGKAP